MGFVEGNSGDVKLVLTNRGKRALLSDGLNTLIKYFSIHDDEVIYTIDVNPRILDINGSKEDATLNNNTNYKQSLK
jgi:hypothetical protein